MTRCPELSLLFGLLQPGAIPLFFFDYHGLGTFFPPGIGLIIRCE